MPTYSFKCPECGYVSEQQLSITELDFAITLCPVCALSRQAPAGHRCGRSVPGAWHHPEGRRLGKQELARVKARVITARAFPFPGTTSVPWTAEASKVCQQEGPTHVCCHRAPGLPLPGRRRCRLPVGQRRHRRLRRRAEPGPAVPAVHLGPGPAIWRHRRQVAAAALVHYRRGGRLRRLVHRAVEGRHPAGHRRHRECRGRSRPSLSTGHAQFIKATSTW